MTRERAVREALETCVQVIERAIKDAEYHRGMNHGGTGNMTPMRNALQMALAALAATPEPVSNPETADDPAVVRERVARAMFIADPTTHNKWEILSEHAQRRYLLLATAALRAVQGGE